VVRGLGNYGEYDTWGPALTEHTFVCGAKRPKLIIRAAMGSESW
jgi:hypothetical protein